jgi:hypothetical protein
MRTLLHIRSDRRSSERALNNQTSPEFEALPTGLYPEHEVLNGECIEEFEALILDFYDEYQPSTPTHRSLVDLLASSEWNLRRYRKIEAQFYEIECSKNLVNGGGGNACEAYGDKTEVIARLHRRIEACERAFARAVRELEHLGCTHHPVPPRPRPAIMSNEAIREALTLIQPPEPEPEPAPSPDPPRRLITADILYGEGPLPKDRKLASFDSILRTYPPARSASRTRSDAPKRPELPNEPNSENRE